MMAKGAVHQVEQVGIFSPKMIPTDDLGPGRDRLHHRRDQDRGRLQCRRHASPTTATPATEALPGFKPSVPVVWCGLYPVDADDFEKLRE